MDDFVKRFEKIKSEKTAKIVADIKEIKAMQPGNNNQDTVTHTNYEQKIESLIVMVNDNSWIDEGDPKLRKEFIQYLTGLVSKESNKLKALWEVKQKLFNYSSLNKNKSIIIGIAVFLVIVFLGAGVPLLTNAIKAKNNTPAAVDNATTATVKTMISKSDLATGFELPSTIDGSTIAGSTQTLSTAAATPGNVLTYSIAVRLGESVLLTGNEVMLVRRNDGNTSVFEIRADPSSKTLEVVERTTNGKYCSYVATDFPLYKWTMVHVVFNNLPNYLTTNIFINGVLLKVGNHNTCEGGIADQTGASLVFGTSGILEVNYFKVVQRTLMIDEIKNEVNSVLNQIAAAELKSLLQNHACTTAP